MNQEAAKRDALSRIQHLEIRAKLLVEGILTGMHRSPRHGFSVEFAQHREYTPGDDFRHIDWKVYARGDRLYLKQYELETNLVAWMVCDASESMQYASADLSKFEAASVLALALSQLILAQGDSVGLARVDSQIQTWLPASGRTTQLGEMARALLAPAQTPQTAIGTTLHEIAERIPPRGIVFVLSDFFDDLESLQEGLNHLRHHKHEVILMQVLDPAELDFPFEQPTLFRGLEQLPELLTDPRGIRESYLREFHAFLDQLTQLAQNLRLDYTQIRSDDRIGRSLQEFLQRRGSRYRTAR
ncbi:DUF58 domain-containing protein [Tuwongella immobilis]|uniref:DUF58 domain-containing protein n=1 Tax=Tuwongella immobilis TaxID=692036 RepID=A0A6C2YPL3_9BACT|nr:DUF58 domain-containing protein [Tuwongella immobilis]VIP03297.1 Uncharacterized protein OS=Blastopirellula marina DSM 3645 GN=DSM3645_19608 PE=4 SV=1: DUF58 [Tuwongella immobilis]VTS03965.1 Uncharacterized protein OS=Blastopirellula marina DSM 3645 GN=DSM3645_19608 PE=4 SV=1: DUF58 [Tuwongella immobilis]